MNDGSSSTTNPSFSQHLRNTRPNVRKGRMVKVPTISLKQICERYFYRRPVFFSLDIEGMEAMALQGNDWNNSYCRPDVWIV